MKVLSASEGGHSPRPADAPDSTSTSPAIVDMQEALERERLLRIEVETLNQVARELTAELDRATLLRKVVEIGASLSGAQFCSFFGVARDGEEPSWQQASAGMAP